MAQLQGAVVRTHLLLLILVTLQAWRARGSAVPAGDGHQTPLPHLRQETRSDPTVMDGKRVEKEALLEGGSRAVPVSDRRMGAVQPTDVPGVDGQRSSGAVEMDDIWKYFIGGAVAIVVSALLGLLWWGLICLRRRRRRLRQAIVAAEKESILREAMRKQPAGLREFIARYSYDPFHGPNEWPELELPLVAGQHVYVYGDVDGDGWYVGELSDGTRGFVPSNLVEEITIDDFGGPLETIDLA